MLEIDYSLIPLAEEDREMVRRVVAEQLKAGNVPTIEKSWYGRAVVLNPDAVHMSHPVPDELRAHLRRMMIHTTEGPTDLTPERLIEEITEPEDPLRVLIIELQSRFAHLGRFLAHIPGLRERYPDLGVYLAGAPGDTLEKLREVMEKEKVTLRLSYPDARGTIEITDAAELTQVVTEGPAPVTFSLPFFSQIRVAPGEGRKPEVFNLDSLRNLAPLFGVGKPREVDLGSGRKEKVIILDLPVRLVRDFQFRQDRGLDFHGIRMNGNTVLSRDFARQKLEYRWVPLKEVEAFQRQVPGEELETAVLAETRVIRVNTFNGKVAFIASSAAEQISFQDLETVTFLRPAGAPGAKGATGPQEIRFDGFVPAADPGSEGEPLQDTIREHVYGAKFREQAEHARKLELYTSRLKVGAVGPLAGQTLKIFRRFGLERLIDPKSFHYLCDTPAQLPDTLNTQARFEQTFADFLASLREIMGGGDADGVRVLDFAHRLPVTLEWVDAQEMSLAAATPEELGTIHGEMHALSNFICEEFKRNFEAERQQPEFFKKAEAAQAAGLTAKWLTDYKRDAFGPPLPPGTLADFVFFGATAEKRENDRSLYFPSLACAELLASDETRKLFETSDYAFSVFLEEQMALATHHYREEGVFTIGALEYGAYFDEQVQARQKELEGLQALLASIESGDTPLYRQLLKEEEAAFQERLRALAGEREGVEAAHREAGQALLALYEELRPELEAANAAAPAAPGADGNDDALLEAVEVARKGKEMVLDTRLAEAVKRMLDRVDGLKGVAEALLKAHRDHREWLRGFAAHQRSEHRAQLSTNAPRRLAALKGLPERDRNGLLQRAQVQLRHADAERHKVEATMAQHEQRFQQSLGAIHEAVNRVLNGAIDMARERSEEKPRQKRQRVAAYVQRLDKVFKSMQAVSAKVNFGVMQFEKLLARGQKNSGDLATLRLEVSLLEALAKGEPPRLPPAPKAGTAPPSSADHQRRNAEHQERVEAFEEGVGAILSGLPAALKEADAALAAYEGFHGKARELHKLAARRKRQAASRDALAGRQQAMEAELADLPARVREKFVPARRELLLNLFIPDAEKTIADCRRAKAFLEELHSIDHGRLQHLYLDRAVYRRFNSNQFLSGACIAMDTASPAANGLRNVVPAINGYHRSLHFNYTKRHPAKVKQMGLKHLKTLPPARLLEFIQEQVPPERQAYDYIVLPSTLELAQAVDLMHRKDRLFHGVPRLVLIFVSKFSAARLQEDAALREAFFRAQKHNVILNIDGHGLVDNPGAIASRLLQETLGSTFDTDEVEEPGAEDEEQVTFKV